MAISSFTGNCVLKFKAKIYNSSNFLGIKFGCAYYAYKNNVSDYSTSFLEVSNVRRRKSSNVGISPQITAYVDSNGYFNLFFTTLVNGKNFFSYMSMNLEISDIITGQSNPLLPNSEGVITLNVATPNNNILWTYGISFTFVTKNYLQQAVLYPEELTVYITDTNNFARYVNSVWYISSASVLS